MPSAWGSAWGSSWGDSWGVISTGTGPPPPTPVLPDSIDPDTALTLITEALLEIRVLDENETASSEQSRDGLRKLNTMIDQWSLDSIMTYVQQEEGFPITAGVSEYTIGENGDFVTARPLKIAQAWIRVNGYDTELEVIGAGRWGGIRAKSAAGFAGTLHYLPTFPRGVIRLVNVPQQDGTLYLVSDKALTQFPSLHTHFAFPPGYKVALIMNLAVRLAPGYHKTPKNETKEIAISSKEAIRRINLPEVVSSLDTALTGRGAFNMLTGGF